MVADLFPDLSSKALGCDRPGMFLHASLSTQIQLQVAVARTLRGLSVFRAQYGNFGSLIVHTCNPTFNLGQRNSHDPDHLLR